MAEIRLPILGVADATPLRETPPQTAPPGTMQNVVPRRAGTARKQLAKRPGLVKVFPNKLGDGPVQGLQQINRASAVSNYTLGAATTLDRSNALSKLSTLVSMNAALVATGTQTIREAFKVDGSGGQPRCRRDGASALQNITAATSGFPNSSTPAWCAIHPSETMLAMGFNYTSSSQNRTLVVFIDPGNGNLIGSKEIAPAGEDTASTNNVEAIGFAWTAEALWVGRGAQMWYAATPVVSGKARLANPITTDMSLADGDTTTPIGQVVGRIVSIATYTLNEQTYLLIAFDGATGGGYFTNPSGTIDTSHKSYAKHYRAGVIRLIQQAATSALAYTYTVDTSLVTTPTTADAYAEVDGTGTIVVHRSIRFSQVLNRGPRGALPQAIAAYTDGSFVVAFTNQGFGPTTSFAPDGSVPYTSLIRFDVDGSTIWEVDAQTVIGSEKGGCVDGSNGYPCDVPNEVANTVSSVAINKTSHDGPAIRALAINPAGVIFAAGRVNTGLFSVFAIEPGSGQLRWRKGLESNRPQTVAYTAVTAGAADHGVPRGGVAADSGDGSCVVVGYRNNTWQSTAFAAVTTERTYDIMWRLDPNDGSFTWGFGPTQDETSSNPSALAVGDGIAFYGCTTFTDT